VGGPAEGLQLRRTRGPVSGHAPGPLRPLRRLLPLLLQAAQEAEAVLRDGGLRGGGRPTVHHQERGRGGSRGRSSGSAPQFVALEKQQFSKISTCPTIFRTNAFYYINYAKYSAVLCVCHV
jgi:hypothetical protein